MKIGLYWILFLGQAIGNGMILSHIIPLVRRLVTAGLHDKTPLKTVLFGAFGVTTIQVCYWLGRHWFTTLRLRYNAFLGHVVLFISRLNFIFASAVFSAVYLVRFNELEITLWRFVFLSSVLFSATRLNLSGLPERYSSAKTVPDQRTAVTQLSPCLKTQ
jgi:hypothetical protein